MLCQPWALSNSQRCAFRGEGQHGSYSGGVSSEAQPVPAVVPTRAGLARRAKLLSWLSIGWMVIEAGVAIVAAVVAASVALLGFGLDSLIELASASVIIWRFSGPREHSEIAER